MRCVRYENMEPYCILYKSVYELNHANNIWSYIRYAFIHMYSPMANTMDSSILPGYTNYIPNKYKTSRKNI